MKEFNLMANPLPAFRHTNCDECGDEIPEGEDVFFTDDGKLCGDCAEDGDFVCECGNAKKAEYETCYECR